MQNMDTKILYKNINRKFNQMRSIDRKISESYNLIIILSIKES